MPGVKEDGDLQTVRETKIWKKDGLKQKLAEEYLDKT